MLKYTEQALADLIKENKTALVFTHTDWCSKCRRVEPFLNVIENNFKNKVIFVDIDGDLVSDKFMSVFDVQELPTLTMVVNGNVCASCKDVDTPEAITKYILECLQ